MFAYLSIILHITEHAVDETPDLMQDIGCKRDMGDEAAVLNIEQSVKIKEKN